jgi:hypothetical protein
MGCNFYDAKGQHIGKRSAAGWYCWDCKQTLCKAGVAGIHTKSDWHDACPSCGRKPKAEGLHEGAVGRELGFNKTQPSAKTGVKSCSSFGWAIDPDKFKKSKRRVIIDEYGQRLSREEFDAVLTECPVQYTYMIGQEFS